MERGVVKAIANGEMLPHALSQGKGFLSSICSHNVRFEMFVWILNGFCGMGYRHIQKKTWVL